ncbi:MAG: twin-arginine translocase TatA/TatE family subunit [Pseudomonadota bacterium]
MGISGISIWQLLIILAIVVMLFGTKRLRNMGSDLGEAIKGFRNSINDKEEDALEEQANNDVIDAKAEKVEDSK